MYFALNVDTPEDFRVEFSHFMSVMRRSIAHDIHKSCEKCQAGIPHSEYQSATRLIPQL